MGLFKKKELTIDRLALLLLKQAHVFLKATTKDLDENKNFPGIARKKIYSELLMLYIWVIGYMKLPFDLRSRFIMLSVDEQSFSDKKKQDNLALIGKRHADYASAWTKGGDEESARRG